MKSHHLGWLLGIDVGSDSIGWAAFRFDPSRGTPDRLLDGGVRLFDWGRDPRSKESHMAERGRKRRNRRRLRGRVWRRHKLADLLKSAGLPHETNPTPDIWPLRARAAQIPVSASELSAVLLYISRHRGFKSPKLSILDTESTKAGENDPSIWDQVERDLRAEMAPGETIGTYLARRLADRGFVRARRGIGRVATRPLIAEELTQIQAVQAPHHVLTAAQWDDIRDLILDQRPLRDAQPGRCTYFPEEFRMAKAMPSAQRYLVRATLANLRIQEDRLAAPRPLTVDEHDLLAAILDRGGTHKWTELRKAIRLRGRSKFTVETERAPGSGKRASQRTDGDQTTQVLSCLWPDWSARPLTDRDALVAELLAARRDRRRLLAVAARHGLDADGAEALADAAQFGLPREHLSLGPSAVDAILRHLRPGVPLHVAIERGVGRPHSERPRADELPQELPYYGQALPHRVLPRAGGSPEEARHGALGNVTVHIALNEIRKVVNKLIERYGNPARIVVETTRELKASTEQLRKIEREQKEREREREKFEREIADDVRRTIGREGQTARAAASRFERIRRIRLAIRQGNLCPYTGNMIARSDLFTARYQVDHIIPLSRGGFDNFENLVVCEAEANSEKAERTPWEAWSFDPARWKRIAESIGRLPEEMLWRFGADAADRVAAEDSGFLPRQIGDTSYIARVAMEYLALVTPQAGATRGRLTAYLRSAWDLPKGRDDHRHHFMDAAVIAVTDRRIVEYVNRLHARGPLPPAKDAGIEPPYADFPLELERRYERIWPSLRPDHSLPFPSGPLHQETHYAVRQDASGRYRRAGRVTLDGLFKQAGRYVDDDKALKAMEKFVSDRFRSRFAKAVATERANDPAVAVAEAAVRAAMQPQFGPRGMDKVLCWTGGNVDDPDRMLRLPRGGERGDNHPAALSGGSAWVDIVAENGRWRALVVDRLEAARIGPEGGIPVNLVYRLRRGDTIAVDMDGRREIMFLKVAKSNGRLYFWPLRVATTMAASRAMRPDLDIPNRDGMSFSAETLRKADARKVTISVLGRLRDPAARR